MSLKTKSKRIFGVLGMFAIATLTMAGCTTAATESSSSGGSSSSSSSGSESTTVNKDDIVLVASVINTTNPYMASNIAGAEALAAELGLPLEIVDSEGSSQVQNSKIQAILAKGKTVVMFVNTVSSSDAPIIVEAVKDAGGFVSIWWNKPDDYEPWDVGNNFVAFQKHPGVPSGQCTAARLAESIGEEGAVIALPGVQDSTTSQTRVAGLEFELETNYPGVELLELRPSNWDPELAYQNAQDLIVKYGDEIKGVWTADDAMQIGAMKAFEDAGLLDQVKFASDGLYPPTIEDMRSGRGNNAIVGETFHRGYMASAIGLYTAYLAATGEINPAELPNDKRNSLFEISCVTPETLEEFTKYDDDIDGWIDQLIENGPWDTQPVPLIGGGPEILP